MTRARAKTWKYKGLRSCQVLGIVVVPPVGPWPRDCVRVGRRMRGLSLGGTKAG